MNFALTAFFEGRLLKTAPIKEPHNAHAYPKSRAAMINAMPIVATFQTSERISGTPAA